MAQATTTRERSAARPIRPTGGHRPLLLGFYRSSVGKKWVMGVTGLLLLSFVLVHLIGNLKLYLSKEELNLYGEALRDMPGHLLPRTLFLWIFRLGLIAAFVLHIHSAIGLTVINRKARPDRYQAPRDYAVATYASRSMRMTGIVIAAYLVFHLADLTWGTANPDFVRGDPYNNLVYSLERPAVAIAYCVAMVALGVHLVHGIWSMFQSMGINNPRYNALRRGIAYGFAGVVLVGNLSFPILVQAGVVEPECPKAPPELSCDEAEQLGQLQEIDR